LLLGSYGFGQAVIRFEGKYQGNNIYVQNLRIGKNSPILCVDNILINGKVFKANISALPFEFKLVILA